MSSIGHTISLRLRCFSKRSRKLIGNNSFSMSHFESVVRDNGDTVCSDRIPETEFQYFKVELVHPYFKLRVTADGMCWSWTHLSFPVTWKQLYFQDLGIKRLVNISQIDTSVSMRWSVKVLCFHLFLNIDFQEKGQFGSSSGRKPCSLSFILFYQISFCLLMLYNFI